MNAQAERWLGFAQSDLAAARVVFDAGLYNQVCFHAQQCVEKAVKGTLVHLGKSPPRIHAITDLLRLLPHGWLAEIAEGLAALDDYYIASRYPDALPGALAEGLPGKDEAEEALNLARTALQLIRQRTDYE